MVETRMLESWNRTLPLVQVSNEARSLRDMRVDMCVIDDKVPVHS